MTRHPSATRAHPRQAYRWQRPSVGAARYRIRVGKRINSSALVADGQHARVDGLTSLGVIFSALGLYLGYPVADPLIGVLITMAIVRIAWLSGKSVLIRLADGVDPQSVEKIAKLAMGEDGVLGVGDVRARWLGHRLHTEVNLKVSGHENVATAHEIADAVRRRLSEKLPHLARIVVTVVPWSSAGEPRRPQLQREDIDPSGPPEGD